MAEKKNAEEKKPAATHTPADKSGKMTIYEYEQKYVKQQNARGAKVFLRVFAAIIGVFLFVLLLLAALRVYEINEYAGYATGAVCLIVYIFIFIVPLVKIMRAPYFMTNVNAQTASKAQRHNKKVRRDIADKMINFSSTVDGAGWYDSELIGKLAIARNTGNDEAVKETLTTLYKGSVKKTAKALIMKSSLRSAMYSALSQSEKIDAALVIAVNTQLIRDLVFLYGFRPSDIRLAKIFVGVIRNSMIALGLGGLNVGNAVVKTMGDAVKGIPILGNLISTIVDSSVQGLANGTLTALIGFQTLRYLNTEYNLQNILDGIDVSETSEELQETCTEIETQLKKKKKLAPAV